MAARHARKLVCPKCGGPYTTFKRERAKGLVEFRVCVPCKEKKDAQYYEENRARLKEGMRKNYRDRKVRFGRKQEIPPTS